MLIGEQNTRQEKFCPVTPAQIVMVVAGLKEKGLSIVGTSGEIRAFGALVQFEFLVSTLTVTLVSAPHFHSMEKFQTQVHDALVGLLES